MSTHTIEMTPELYDYYRSMFGHEPDILVRLREHTQKLEQGRMQISPEVGVFLGLMVKLIHAKHILEIGTFTGYSALSMALALPDNGKLIALDRSQDWTKIAREFWQKAGVDHKIDLRIAPALESLATMPEKDFDLVFIDADKVNQTEYYEQALQKTRPGGLIIIDNTLWSGRVANPSEKDDNTTRIRAFNHHLHTDTRIDLSVLPIGDGLTLARKK